MALACAKTPLVFLKSLLRDERNILEAASSGASASIGLVANIAANLIAFLAILGFINQALSWLGGMVGYPSLTFQVRFTAPLSRRRAAFEERKVATTSEVISRRAHNDLEQIARAPLSLSVQLICSYVFMPVAFMMGIPYDESFTVAELIGTKVFLNEFVAYEKLAKLKANRLSGVEELLGGERQWISVRRPSTRPPGRRDAASSFVTEGFSDVRSEQKSSPPTRSVDSPTSARWAS